jgi:hypothetical protein
MPCIDYQHETAFTRKNVRFTIPIQQLYNNPSYEGGSHILGPTLMWGVVVKLLYWCCTRIKSPLLDSQHLPFWPVQQIIITSLYRDLILTLHHHNNCTTTSHMKVDPSVWDSPSCEGLLCSCCIDVVNLTFSLSSLSLFSIRRWHASLKQYQTYATFLSFYTLSPPLDLLHLLLLLHFSLYPIFLPLLLLARPKANHLLVHASLSKEADEEDDPK